MNATFLDGLGMMLTSIINDQEDLTLWIVAYQRHHVLGEWKTKKHGAQYR